MKSFFKRSLSLVVVLTLLGTMPAVSATTNETGSDEVVKNFMNHVQGLAGIDDDLKQEIKQLVNDLREDEYSRMEAVTAGLAKIYPAYDKAISATQDDDTSRAIGLLQAHVDSDDPFLAADAAFFLARTMMNDQRHEEAIPYLEKLADEQAEFTLHAGPAIYFKGVAQANLLENHRAISSFQRFLEQSPDSPERLRVSAWRQIQVIESIKEGAMADVLQRMDFSRRRLELKNTDKTTQGQQDRVVSMLAKLIREQEKKECSSCNSKKNSEGQKEGEGKSQKDGQSNDQKQGKSDNGGTSNNPNGVVRRTFDDGPASPWSKLRQRSRDAANNAIKEKLPARYRNVVEKYYESTSGNDKDPGK